MTERRRTVAFVGNCQGQALAQIYGRSVGPLLGDNVIYVDLSPTTAPAKVPALLGRLRDADVIVDQKFESEESLPAELFSGRPVRRVRFPYIGGRFYWPYAGPPHASCKPPPDLPPLGPYPGELGDAALNQLIRDEVPVEEAVQRYDATMESGRARFRRLAELHLARQQERDAACGMDFATYIAANYQRESLFTTQGHLRLTLARMLAEQVFLAFDVPYSLVDAALRAMRTPPFPRSEAPIHPAVAEALGLGFVTPEQRYVFHHEGRFTQAEFVRRYLGSVWEPDLQRGILRFFGGDTEGAVALLQQALQRCDGSGIVWRTLGVGLSRLGRRDEAEAAMVTAAQRDPEDPETFAAWSRILVRAGRLAEAEAAARRAVEQFPFGAIGHRALAEVLARQHRLAEAVAVARLAWAMEPGDANGLSALAHHLQRAGRLQEAMVTLHRAREMEPANRSFDRMHAVLQARIGRLGGERLRARPLPGAEMPQEKAA